MVTPPPAAPPAPPRPAGLRLVLFGMGSRGDVQPLLGLGQTLRARGHQVLVAAPPNFGAWVRNLGFDFAAIGVDMQQFLAENPQVLTGNPLKAGPIQKRFFASELPRQMQELLAVSQGADALVWGGLGFAAPSVAERLGCPALGLLYSSCVLPSALHAPPEVPLRGLPPMLNRALWWLHRHLVAGVVGQPLNRARQTLGLAPVELQHHLLAQCEYTLAVDATLFPADPAWPRQVRHSGYLVLDEGQLLDAELEAWLRDGPAPLYLGFGSMAGAAPQRLLGLLQQALQASDQRCLVSAGWAGLGGPTLPRHWRGIAAAPHALLFARMAGVVHHGGSGTVASALRAGVPQVLLPLILDQYHHAHMLHRAGLIPRPVAMERITAAELAASVAAAMDWPRAPLQAAAQRLQECDANTQTAAQLEALVSRG